MRGQPFGEAATSPDARSRHSAAPSEADIERVFMKVAFSSKRFFDNRELRRNPAFDIDRWYLADLLDVSCR